MKEEDEQLLRKILDIINVGHYVEVKGKKHLCVIENITDKGYYCFVYPFLGVLKEIAF